MESVRATEDTLSKNGWLETNMEIALCHSSESVVNWENNEKPVKLSV